jgi:uncharacterized membrane protein
MGERRSKASRAGFSWLQGASLFAGVIGAVVFFALSLSPSLLPRTWVTLGLLSGFSAAIGFWAGQALVWLWQVLELPPPRGRLAGFLRLAALTGALVLAGYFLWLTSEWQDSARALMGMAPVAEAHLVRIVAVALVLMAALLAVGRAFAWSAGLFTDWLERVIPRRISVFSGLVLAAALFGFVSTGTLGRWMLDGLDATFLELDGLIDPKLPPPSDPARTGSAASLVPWRELGREGRSFVASGPDAGDIERVTGRRAMQPVRVYVGLGGGETPEARAELAFQEMLRTGAFERSVLVIATPTGTGWIDPGAVDTLEYLHSGDTALVAVQYSYLQSYVSLFVEPGKSADTARALFDRIYRHWTALPQGARPRLYLHGLSLGAYGSEQSTGLYIILQDLINGAVWSGPPFRSAAWSAFTAGRNAGSPAWLPRFHDGSMVRFTGQENALEAEDFAPWGPVRLVYLQYASDPITFFSPRALWRKPAWLAGRRGPDVSPELMWVPIITALQVGFDMIRSTAVPLGYGHNYAPSDYIDAWMAVTEPAGWDDGAVAALKAHMEQAAEAE